MSTAHIQRSKYDMSKVVITIVSDSGHKERYEVDALYQGGVSYGDAVIRERKAAVIAEGAR